MTDDSAQRPLPHARRRHRRGRWTPLARLGPGLITGVADDDPSGIATYSQAGAGFGLDMLWTMPLSYPLMSAVQLMCAEIGRVTGKGLAANIKTTFPPLVLRVVVLLLLIANTLNIAADIAAMGEVGELVTHVNRHVMALAFTLVTVGLQVGVPYHRYVGYLKWLALSLLAYPAVLFMVHVPWGAAAARLVRPQLRLDADSAATIVALFGTTISPYLFFWQASEEIEDMARDGGAPLIAGNRATARREFARMRFDTWSGMAYSNLAALFIILATAVTLHVAGITQIDTAAQAASALRPIAGDFAFALFSLGLIGVGLIGVPVLAGSAAYAAAETMGWKEGLEETLPQARGFYGVVVVSMVLGLALQFSPMPPMRALFWSAVINGVVAVPLIVVITLLAGRRAVMGEWRAGWPIRALGWITAAVMAAAVVGMALLPA